MKIRIVLSMGNVVVGRIEFFFTTKELSSQRIDNNTLVFLCALVVLNIT